MRKSNLLIICAALALAGCETFAPVRTVEVKVQVPVSCATGDRPDLPTNRYGTLPPGVGVDYAIEALKGDRAAWESFGIGLNAKTAGCWKK